MHCYLSAVAGLALIGGSISTLTVTKQQQDILKNVFSDELDIKYEKIIKERRNHYLIGLIIGIILSIIIVNNIHELNKFTRMSLFITITLITALVFYMIIPKSDYMLNYLQTSEENKKWLEVYKTMKNRYFIGLVLGILASIPIANIYC